MAENTEAAGSPGAPVATGILAGEDGAPASKAESTAAARRALPGVSGFQELLVYG